MSDQHVSLWESQEGIQQIKEMYGKGLTQGEWNTFLEIGLATKLNPFLREIWAVKYGSGAANIFIGRDGYRRSAQAHPEYDYHYSFAVYSNDVVKNVNGEIIHESNLQDPGKLIMAYGICKRKNSSKANFVRVLFKEYSTGKSLWGSKPETMICKVAEAQVLRSTFQELFKGTYDESEMWEEKEGGKSGVKKPTQKVQKNRATPDNVVYAPTQQVQENTVPGNVVHVPTRLPNKNSTTQNAPVMPNTETAPVAVQDDFREMGIPTSVKVVQLKQGPMNTPVEEVVQHTTAHMEKVEPSIVTPEEATGHSTASTSIPVQDVTPRSDITCPKCSSHNTTSTTGTSSSGMLYTRVRCGACSFTWFLQ